MQAEKQAGKPFCLLLNIADPHKPFYAEGKKGKLVDDPNVPTRVFKPEEVVVPGFLPDDPVIRQELALYYSSVRRADDGVGAILDALNTFDHPVIEVHISQVHKREPFRHQGVEMQITSSLGVVELERQAVLLAAADDRLVAVLVVDGATRMLPLGRPLKVREVDVELLRAWARPHAAANSRAPDDPLRPSAGTRAHHIRIVPGRRVELSEGLTLSQLLEAMFADIEARATTPPRPPRREPAAPAPKAASADAAPRRPKRPKLKGKTWVPYVLRYFRKMALESSLDLVGLTGTIIAAIQARFPEFTITGEAFADALKLIAATGTCLIAPHQKGERIWRINLEGLRDPTSAQHRRLCRETRGRVRVEVSAPGYATAVRAVAFETRSRRSSSLIACSRSLRMSSGNGMRTGQTTPHWLHSVAACGRSSAWSSPW